LHNSSGNYEVTAATLQLNGYSPFGQTGTAFAGYVYEYTATGVSESCGWWGFCYSYFYSYPVYAPTYVAVDQFADSLTLSSGGESASGSVFGSGNPTSYYGSLVALLGLGGTQIADANSTGSIGFTASAHTNTDVQLNGASLTLTLAPIESEISAVPEPQTWAMMIVGFGAAGFALRRNRRRASRVAIA
jgi:hypothetical protein